MGKHQRIHFTKLVQDAILISTTTLLFVALFKFIGPLHKMQNILHNSNGLLFQLNLWMRLRLCWWFLLWSVKVKYFQIASYGSEKILNRSPGWAHIISHTLEFHNCLTCKNCSFLLCLLEDHENLPYYSSSGSYLHCKT